ncbi:MAG TPA: DUF1552 domain-containing protein [Polyangia bacterium]
MKGQRTRLTRRGLLAGLSTGLGSLLLRPLVAAADGPPARLLIVHRPCGTIPARFFPQGGTPTEFQLGPIMTPLAPFQKDMIILNDVTCPRNPGWSGDKHGAGIITMMTGKRPISNGGEITSPESKSIVGADKSIDQVLLGASPRLQGARVPSIHLGAYRDSVQGGAIQGGTAAFRVVSYSGPNRPNFPEVRPMVAVQALFGDAVPGGAAAIARAQMLNKSVLDLVGKDLARLQAQIPQAQKGKLEAHLGAIQQLERQLSAMPAQNTCSKPTPQPAPAARPGVRIDELQHQLVSREQLQIIKTAFQCDLTRVATFTFAHGNSDLRFANIVQGFPSTSGHHDISHLTGNAVADQLSTADRFYCERLAEFLTEMKNTSDGPGSTLLDNTLVVFLSEVSLGAGHTINKMPVVYFGGKNLGFIGGRQINFAGRYMNDIWAATAKAFGVTFPNDRFAGQSWDARDPVYGQGAVSGLV